MRRINTSAHFLFSCSSCTNIPLIKLSGCLMLPVIPQHSIYLTCISCLLPLFCAGFNECCENSWKMKSKTLAIHFKNEITEKWKPSQNTHEHYINKKIRLNLLFQGIAAFVTLLLNKREDERWSYVCVTQKNIYSRWILFRYYLCE